MHTINRLDHVACTFRLKKETSSQVVETQLLVVVNDCRLAVVERCRWRCNKPAGRSLWKMSYRGGQTLVRLDAFWCWLIGCLYRPIQPDLVSRLQFKPLELLSTNLKAKKPKIKTAKEAMPQPRNQKLNMQKRLCPARLGERGRFL